MLILKVYEMLILSCCSAARHVVAWGRAGCMAVVLAGIVGCGDYQTAFPDPPEVRAFRAGNYPLAWRLIEPLAANGNYEAQARLALMYARGLHVDKDIVEAFKWAILAKRGHFYGADLVYLPLKRAVSAEESQEAIQRADAFTSRPLSPSYKALRAAAEAESIPQP